jgi:hypothetical protein
VTEPRRGDGTPGQTIHNPAAPKGRHGVRTGRPFGAAALLGSCPGVALAPLAPPLAIPGRPVGASKTTRLAFRQRLNTTHSKPTRRHRWASSVPHTSAAGGKTPFTPDRTRLLCHTSRHMRVIPNLGTRRTPWKIRVFTTTTDGNGEFGTSVALTQPCEGDSPTPLIRGRFAGGLSGPLLPLPSTSRAAPAMWLWRAWRSRFLEVS